MTHEEVETWRESKLTALRGGDLNDALEALLALTYYDPDRSFPEDLLRSAVDPGNDPELRRLAITCLGHVARIHGEVDEESVMKLRQLLPDSKLGGAVADALGDIESFTDPT